MVGRLSRFLLGQKAYLQVAFAVSFRECIIYPCEFSRVIRPFMLRQVDLSLRSCGEGTCPWCTSRSCEFLGDSWEDSNKTVFVLVGFWWILFIMSPTMMMCCVGIVF